MTAAALQAQQFLPAVIEFMIADRGDRKIHRIERLDRRFVMEQSREQRAGADQVAGGDDDRVWIAGDGVLEMRCQVLGAARRRLSDRAVRAGRRLDVPVKVVDREQLNNDRGGTAYLPDRGGCHEHGNRQREDTNRLVIVRPVTCGLLDA